jgi:hypothetical protein
MALVVISEPTHRKLKEFAKRNGSIMQAIANHAIEEFLRMGQMGRMGRMGRTDGTKQKERKGGE